MQNSSINSSAYGYLLSFINKDKLKIWDLYVEGPWLKAILSSGVRFSVRNKNYAGF